MVSNLTTMLQYCYIKCPKLVVCQYRCCQCGFYFQVVYCHYLCHLYQWAPWVGSNLEMWSGPAGYTPSYFVLEGGKGVGRSTRESQAPLLCRSTPPRAR